MFIAGGFASIPMGYPNAKRLCSPTFFCRCMLSISFWLRNVEFAMAFSFKMQNCLIAFLSDQFEEEQKAGVIKLSKSLGNFE